MNSAERVQTAFRHREPDRVPRWCGASPEFWEKAKQALGIEEDEALRRRLGDDFRRVLPEYRMPERPLGPTARHRTIFGVEHGGLGWGQPLSHPLAGVTSVEELNRFDWPDPAWVDLSHVEKQLDGWDGQYAILGGDWSPFWHDAIDLVGMEVLLMQMFDRPALVDALLDRLMEFYLQSSRKMFERFGRRIDIFFIGNDFGSNVGPLIGPPLFKRFLLPQLKRLIDLGHEFDLWVQLHCCGGFEPLIPLMIEAGLDALHAIQPSCAGMNLEKLKKQYGDWLVFNGGVDSQRVLIEADSPETVRQATLETLRIMAPGGGYVLGASHDSILEETPVENVLAMFDAVEEFADGNE